MPAQDSSSPLPTPSQAEASAISERALRKAMYREALADTWHYLADGKVSVQPRSLSAALEATGKGRTALLLHASQLAATPRPWMSIDPDERLNTQQRALMEQQRDQRVNRVLGQAALLAVLLAVVTGASYIMQRNKDATPQAAPTVIERLQAEIDRQGGQIANIDERPRLRLVAAHTEHQFLITNTGSQPWPTTRIELNGPEGFVYNYDRIIIPSRTLTIRFDDFEREGTRFNFKEMDLEGVRVEVPGFREYERDL